MTVPVSDERSTAADGTRSLRLGLARLTAAGARTRDPAVLAAARRLADQVPPETLARCAVYGRTVAGTRDLPALLFGLLERADPTLADAVFERVIDDGPTLRAWVGHVRSGAAGRASLGSASKRRVRCWLAARSDAALLRASVGNAPSLADIVRLAHPRPRTPQRSAFYAWLLRRRHMQADLPEVVRALIAYRADPQGTPPQVPIELLTATPGLTAASWTELAQGASWQELRRHLNAFARHGALDDPGIVDLVTRRLVDPIAIRDAGATPAQVLAARFALDPTVPKPVQAALDVALEHALASVPPLFGRVVVVRERSEAMNQSLTGGATSLDQVAGAVTRAVSARNPTARVVPWTPPGSAVTVDVAGADLVLVLSARSVTRSDLRRWDMARTEPARLVWLALAADLGPAAPARRDVLDLTGFGDGTFALITRFAAGLLGPDPWASELARIEL